MNAAIRARFLAAMACSLAGIHAFAGANEPSRGAVLYEMRCIACHTEQVHWRDRGLVTDWQSLRAQVWRWQSNANLGWSDADIVEVARYLNRTYYRLPETPGPRDRRE